MPTLHNSVVPVQLIFRTDYPKYKEHLFRLSEKDRYLRFGTQITDEAISNYVDGISNRDTILGVFENDMLVGAVHIAFGDNDSAEVGISVDSDQRGKGYGSSLVANSISHARNRGRKYINTVCLTSNNWMINKCRSIGMTIVRDGSDAYADMEVLPPDMLSIIADATTNISAWYRFMKTSSENFSSGLN